MLNGKRSLYSELKLLSQKFQMVASAQCSQVSKNKISVKIPPRIERSPTDILKALSATVGRDPTAYHYKYPDDPFWNPYNNSGKRKLALSLESGRKSARWIFKNHPEFFKEVLSDPFIKELSAKPVYDENSEVDESHLIEVINDRNVLDAISLYNILEKKCIEVSKDTKQSLLELTCFYNCEEKENNEELELRWFENMRESLRGKTWKDDGFAEKLFESIGEDCPLACSAIIQGRLKHNQVDTALDLFNRARKKNMTLTIGVYNGMLEHVTSILEGTFKRWMFIEELLKEMEEKQINPNLHTMNSVLKSLSLIKRWFEREDRALRIIGEFKKLGIQPSLGTYHYFISIFAYNTQRRGEMITFYTQLLKDLHKENLEVRHPADFLFFNTGMQVFSSVYKNSSLAKLLHSLLCEKDNIKFIVKGFHETRYYTDYVNLMFGTHSAKESMEVFRSLVPSVFTPDISVYLNILSAISRDEAFEFLGEIWTLIKGNPLMKISREIEAVLDMVPAYKGEPGDEVWKIFHEAASMMCSNDKNNQISGQLMSMQDSLVSNIFVAFMKNNNDKKCLEIMAEFSRDGNLTIVGGKTLIVFCDYWVAKKDLPSLLLALKYAEKKNLPERPEMAKRVLLHFPELSENDREWVTKLADKSKK